MTKFEEAARNYRYRPKVHRLVKRQVTPRKKRNSDETIQLTATSLVTPPKARKRRKVSRKAVLKKKDHAQQKASLIQRQNEEREIQTKYTIILWLVMVFLISAIIGPIIKNSMPVKALPAAVPSNATLEPPTPTPYIHSTLRVISPTLLGLSGWQRDYVNFHEKVSAHFKTHGQPPPGSRMLVYITRDTSPNNRYSEILERQKSIISLFAFCVAHQIAFYVDWPLAQEIYDFPHVSLYINSTELWKETSIWDEPFQTHLQSFVDSALLQNITLVQTRRFQLYKLFDDKFLDTRQSLESKGFTVQNAFYLLFSFLFIPVEPIFNSIQPLLSKMSKSTSIFLQIPRENSEWKESSREDIEFFSRVVKCASILQERTFSPTTIVWLLMADSSELKKIAKAKFSDFDIITFDTAVTNGSDIQEELQWNVAQQFLGSFCDYFIISDSEGLDVAMQSSNSTDRIFPVNIGDELDSGFCEPANFELLWGSEF